MAGGVNVWRGAVHDELLPRLPVSGVVYDNITGANLLSTQGPVWADFGGSVTSGDGIARPQLKSFVVDLELANVVLDDGDLITVTMYLQRDKGPGVDAFVTARTYNKTFVQNGFTIAERFRDPIPMTNQYGGFVHRRVAIHVALTGPTVEASVGFTFADIKTL